MKWLIVGLLLCAAIPAHAQGIVNHLYLGANAAWLNGGEVGSPTDIELGASASSSLSPHISLVGSAFRGMVHEYWVPRIGARITASDANNRNFSVGVGIEYQLSESVIGPKEFCSTAQLGYRPWPGHSLDRLLLIGQGSYGTKSKNARTLVGARWAFSF